MTKAEKKAKMAQAWKTNRKNIQKMIMIRAWEIAREMLEWNPGKGTARDYIAAAMKDSWREAKIIMSGSRVGINNKWYNQKSA